MKLFLNMVEERQFDLTPHAPFPEAPWIELSEKEWDEYLWAILYMARWQQRIIKYCEIPEGFDGETPAKPPKRRKGAFVRREVGRQ